VVEEGYQYAAPAHLRAGEEAWIKLGRSVPGPSRKLGKGCSTTLRLSRVLGMPADFRLGLQQGWDPWNTMNLQGQGSEKLR